MLSYQRKKQLSILVKIAMVDDHFADKEKDVILKISERYGASEEEINEIINSSGYSESLSPMSVTEKMEFMMDCMLVVLADEMVASSEEYFARQIAISLGFQQEVIPMLIDHQQTPREEMPELMLPFLSN